MNIAGLPNFANLDLSGEAAFAAERMEARGREPSSARMFDALVAPLLPDAPGARILEVGAGTGTLSRRIHRARPEAKVFASDKSEGMLEVARALADAQQARVEICRWDVVDEAAFPFGDAPFDLIVSSVMVPYLSDAEVEDLVTRLARRLVPGGTLAFIEQDLLTDSVNLPSFDLLRRVFARDGRALKRTLALGLRPLLRAAGLQLLPRASFLWTDDHFGPYVRNVLTTAADDALKAGRITAEERQQWWRTLEALAEEGDFYYGLVYHRVAGTRPR
ncbi:MAG: methyltransferase domain-containing protein [Myxococcaceae bacterium]|nr:methyltransferase domain-containing protein [Myxococcaceae bacterium]